MLFYSTLFAIVFFIIVDVKSFKSNHLSILKKPSLWVMLSSSVLVVWGAKYYSTVYGNANFYIAISFLVNASLAALMSRYFLKAVICLGGVILCWVFEPGMPYIVIALSIMGGIFTFVYIKSSYTFSQRSNLNAKGVLSIRFYLMLAASFLLAVFSPSGIASLSIDGVELFLLALLSTFLLIIPNYLSQSSLQLLGVSKFSFIISFLPVVTFLLEALFHGVWNSGMFFVNLAVAVILNVDPKFIS